LKKASPTSQRGQTSLSQALSSLSPTNGIGERVRRRAFDRGHGFDATPRPSVVLPPAR
jgi:hypothetical protein